MCENILLTILQTVQFMVINKYDALHTVTAAHVSTFLFFTNLLTRSSLFSLYDVRKSLYDRGCLFPRFNSSKQCTAAADSPVLKMDTNLSICCIVHLFPVVSTDDDCVVDRELAFSTWLLSLYTQKTQKLHQCTLNGYCLQLWTTSEHTLHAYKSSRVWSK